MAKTVRLSQDEVDSVRDRLKRMRAGAPKAPVDPQTVRLRVAKLLFAKRTDAT
jgi:hypothetical protein